MNPTRYTFKPIEVEDPTPMDGRVMPTPQAFDTCIYRPLHPMLKIIPSSCYFFYGNYLNFESPPLLRNEESEKKDRGAETLD